MIDLSGVCHFAKWVKTLDAVTRARITIALDRVERGSLSAAKGVGAGVSELRLHFGPGYRIYFGRDGEALIMLLAGGTEEASADRYRTGENALERVQKQ